MLSQQQRKLLRGLNPLSEGVEEADEGKGDVPPEVSIEKALELLDEFAKVCIRGFGVD